MQDYNNKRVDRDRSVELLKPSSFNDKKLTLQELKSEYTKAYNLIDTLKLDKNNLMETIKLVSNRKPEFGASVSSTSASNLKGVTFSQNEKKIVQLEQEIRELKKALADPKASKGHAECDKKILVLEQENSELKRTVDLKTDQIMALQKGVFAQKDQADIERLEKNNRHLKSQVEFLTQDLDRATKKFQDMEEGNARVLASSGAFPVGSESHQTIIKYMNYILNTINVFQSNSPMRACFDERFISALEVHRLINTKDYLSLLLKSLKYISDILIIGDSKSSDAKALATKNPNVQESELSALLSKPVTQPPSATKRKSVGISGNRPNTPLMRSSGSATLNTSLATNCQTPVTSAIQTPLQDTRTSASVVKKHGRTFSQEIICLNKTESHIIYGSPPMRQNKNLSIVPDRQLNVNENTAPIREGRNGSLTSRDEEKVPVVDLKQESDISPKLRHPSNERERRSKGGAYKSMTLNSPVEASYAEKEKALNERENQLKKMDEDLQGRRDKLRNLSRELDRRESREVDRRENREAERDREKDSFSSSFHAKRGHKRVNTDSCISIKNVDTEQDEEFSAMKNVKEEDKSLIRLKPVLKNSSYNNREREHNYEYEARSTSNQFLRNEDILTRSEDGVKRSGAGNDYVNPYSSPKDPKDRDHDFNRNYQYLESSSHGLNERGKSPLRRHASDFRVGLRSDVMAEVTNFRDDYERPRKVQREDDYGQKYLDDDIYQPKILPRPLPRDKLEDFSNGGTPLSSAFNRSKTQSTLKTSNLLSDIKTNQFTFEVADNTEEDLLERKLSVKALGNVRSPSSASLRPRGSNYASFQVAFGRTEAKDRVSPTPQDKRPKSPSILDVKGRKRVDHVDQTYDVVRGEDLKNKQGERQFQS